MRRFIFVIVSICLFITCNGQEKKGNKEITDTKKSSQEQPVATSPKETQLTFEKNIPSVVMKDSINGIGDSKVYVFEGTKGKTLFVTVRPEKTPANIRVKQIISPSGVEKGPYGIDVEYKLKETGTWKVIIDESNMNGESYVGYFMLGIAVR